MKSFEIRTNKKIEIVDITSRVEANVGENKTASAILIFAPHATAAITIGEYEPNIRDDMEKFYAKLTTGNHAADAASSPTPLGVGDWKHDLIDDNAEAHLLSTLIKPSLVVPLENGKLILGTWQRILFVELDGPRTRRIHTSAI